MLSGQLDLIINGYIDMKLERFAHYIFAILFAGLNIIYLIDSILTERFTKMATNAICIILLLIGFGAGFFFGKEVEKNNITPTAPDPNPRDPESNCEGKPGSGG